MDKKLERIARIKRIDEDRRLVYAEVYTPYTLDTYGEFMFPEDIEQMAHRFMKLDLSQTIDTNHDNEPNGSYPVESFIAREEDPDYTPGSWVLGVHVPEDHVWTMVKSGELNGFSFEAMMRAVEYVVSAKVVRDHVGETQEANGHTHMFFVHLNEQGLVTGGITSEDEGHFHTIVRASFTQEANDHTHRYDIN